MKLIRTSASLAVLAVAFTLAACSGSSIDPSVSGAAPHRAFRGRTVDVLLSGSGTTWDGTSTVLFGDGITVNKITAASPTALVANITVANDAPLGPRDVTVTQGSNAEPYKMAFSIESPIDVTVNGTTAQGSIVSLTIVNKDLEHLFDDTSTGGGLFSAPTYTNVAIKAPAGTTLNIDSVTPFKVQATMLIDVKATPVKFDLLVKSGPIDGKRDEFPSPALFDIAARTAEPLTAGAMFAVEKASASKLYTFTPGGVDHKVSITATPDDSNQSPSLVVIDEGGTFMDVIANGASVSWIIDSVHPVYVLVFDAGGEGGYNISLKTVDVLLATQTGGEGDDTLNNVRATATVLQTPPIRVKGASLSSKTDVDCYKVTVPVGKVIHAQTIPGDANTDTTLQFFDKDGTTKLNAMPIDNGYHEDEVSPALAGAGDYYVCVGASSYFSASASAYDLVVTLE